MEAMVKTERYLYCLLAELLEYPRHELSARARECRDLLATTRPEAAGLMGEFATFVEGTPRGRLEEVYSATFDLSPDCCPYAGYHLFGDDPKRADLMIGLQQSYRAIGFSAENELPDHLALLLRFLAQQADLELERDLLDRVVVPTLEKMSKLLEGKNPYGNALKATLLVCGEAGGVGDV